MCIYIYLYAYIYTYTGTRTLYCMVLFKNVFLVAPVRLPFIKSISSQMSPAIRLWPAVTSLASKRKSRRNGLPKQQGKGNGSSAEKKGKGKGKKCKGKCKGKKSKTADPKAIGKKTKYQKLKKLNSKIKTKDNKKNAKKKPTKSKQNIAKGTSDSQPAQPAPKKGRSTEKASASPVAIDVDLKKTLVDTLNQCWRGHGCTEECHEFTPQPDCESTQWSVYWKTNGVGVLLNTEYIDGFVPKKNDNGTKKNRKIMKHCKTFSCGDCTQCNLILAAKWVSRLLISLHFFPNNVLRCRSIQLYLHVKKINTHIYIFTYIHIYIYINKWISKNK